MKHLYFGGLAGVFLLAGCASMAEPERQQMSLPDGCVSVAGTDLPATKVCPKRIRFGGTIIGAADAMCIVTLKIREDGTVSQVKVPVAKPRSFESHCVRNAYRWRFEVTRDGHPVAISGLKAGITSQAVRDIEIGPELDRGQVRIMFSTEMIDHLAHR